MKQLDTDILTYPDTLNWTFLKDVCNTCFINFDTIGMEWASISLALVLIPYFVRHCSICVFLHRVQNYLVCFANRETLYSAMYYQNKQGRVTCYQFYNWNISQLWMAFSNPSRNIRLQEPPCAYAFTRRLCQGSYRWDRFCKAL